MRTPSALGLGVLAIASVLSGCAGEGGGGGGGAPQPPRCKPPAGGATVSFANNIQPIFNRSCAVPGCHVPPVPTGGQDLTSARSYRQAVNTPSTQVRGIDRVEPGNPDRSYMLRKIQGGPGIAGTTMPQGCPGAPLNGAQCLSPDDIAAIVQWITECAPNN